MNSCLSCLDIPGNHGKDCYQDPEIITSKRNLLWEIKN